MYPPQHEILRKQRLRNVSGVIRNFRADWIEIADTTNQKNMSDEASKRLGYLHHCIEKAREIVRAIDHHVSNESTEPLHVVLRKMATASHTIEAAGYKNDAVVIFALISIVVDHW